jgi:hypothetical protein
MVINLCKKILDAYSYALDYSLTKFLKIHPGGAAILLQYAGKDATLVELLGISLAAVFISLVFFKVLFLTLSMRLAS